MARLTLVTDAWMPQVNGAVTTLANTVRTLRALGHTVEVIDPSLFPTIPCPTYPEIPLARSSVRDVAARIDRSRPDHVLIAIEGPLGLAARRAMIRSGRPFATAFLTRFHDYLWERFRMPRFVTLQWLAWYHGAASRVFTPTPVMRDLLVSRGLHQARTWWPGVDVSVFRPRSGPAQALIAGLPRPIVLHVGRVAVEKNVEAFLALDVPGSKVLVGDGPLLPALKARYPDTLYLGYRSATEIAEICSASDCLVFPSRTDTFGHVMVEALACGLPVAAYPERGPRDVLLDPRVGAMDNDLIVAVAASLRCDRDACVGYARRTFDWVASTEGLLSEFKAMSALSPLGTPATPPAELPDIQKA